MKINSNKQGVSQVLNRLTYPSMVSHLRSRYKHQQIIQVNLYLLENFIVHHGDMFVLVKRPEGQAVGVVKNLSMNCEITTSLTSETALFYIKRIYKRF